MMRASIPEMLQEEVEGRAITRERLPEIPSKNQQQRVY
jgi:hypothetical protein